MRIPKPDIINGTAATEFLLVALPLLVMGLGAFDVARWHLVRQTVGHALLEAARAGAVSHADPQAIQGTLQRALQPLQGARHAMALQARYGLAPWHIEVVSPRAGHFNDFPGPPRLGMRTIRHSYQHEQHLRAIAAGRPLGRGPASDETVFQANTLVLRLTYLHTPLAPGMRPLLRLAGRLADAQSFGGQAMRAAGVVAMRQTVSVAMQSAPYEWPANAHTALRPQHTSQPAAHQPAGMPASPPYAACTRPACGQSGSAQPMAGAGQHAAAPSTSSNAPPLSGDPDMGQACAAALCCAGTAG